MYYPNKLTQTGILVAFSLVFTSLSFAQASQATFISDTLYPNQVLHRLDLSSTETTLSEIEVKHFQISGSDTLEVFNGSLRLTDMDPSAFYSFQHEGSVYRLGLGIYEKGNYYSQMILRREDQTTQTITIN